MNLLGKFLLKNCFVSIYFRVYLIWDLKPDLLNTFVHPADEATLFLYSVYTLTSMTKYDRIV